MTLAGPVMHYPLFGFRTGPFTCLALSRDGQAPIVWSRCSVSRALGVPIHPKVGVVVGVGSSR